MRGRRTYWLLLGACFAACSGEDLVDDPPEAAEHRFGLMSVAYEFTIQDTNATSLLKSTAQFVHYSALKRPQVNRLLALPLDPAADLPADTGCRTYDLTLDLAGGPQADPGHVELLEAGQLRVETASGVVSLVPQHFPGLLPFVSGVVYGEAQSTRQAIDFENEAGQALGLVRVVSAGGETVGSFRTQLAGPERPQITSIGASVAQDAMRVSPREPLIVAWRTRARLDETTYAQLRYRRDDRDWAIRCRASSDAQQLTIPIELIAATARAQGPMMFELGRIRQAPFSAEGLDSGQLRLALRERLSLRPY